MGAALLLFSAGAKAQEPAAANGGGQRDVPKETTAAANVPDIVLGNQIDFGVRGTSFGANSDQARFQRYQDLRDGGFLDRFRFNKQTDQYLFIAQADHVGYRDQRFSVGYNNYGRVKAAFVWNQVPLFFSQDTRTLYSTSSSGALTLDPAIQSGIQNKTLTLAQAVTGASLFDLRSKRDVADFNLVYSANRNVDLNFTVKNTIRNGSQPYGAGFGFTQAIEVPVPIDHRTTDIGSAIEFSNNRGFARLAYDGSFFRNNVSTMVYGDPLRLTDSATLGPAQGRMALWPNSNLNTVSASGSLKLAWHSQATAYLSVGQMSQNDPLIPFTINSALVSPPLDRPTAEAKARVTAMNYSFTSRPASTLWFSARYRQYQFDNRTAPFNVTNTVSYDTSLAVLNSASEPIGYTRHTFDGDASYAPFTYIGFRGGYTREQIDQTFRMIDSTTEDTGRASVDLTGISWITVRGVYEHGKRRGSPVNELDLIAAGIQPTLRQFDVSNRDHDRFSTILQITPVSQFSINASAAIGKENYPGANFGLRNNDNHVYTVGFDFVPIESVNLGASYGYERYTALQASRTANPLPAGGSITDLTQQWNDPRRDWTDNSADQVHTVNASIDLPKAFPRTDIKLAYDYTRGQSTYVYGLAANTVLPAAVQLPAVMNELQRGTVDIRYFLTKHVATGVVYWYDAYSVNDFALGPQVFANTLAQPSFLALGYVLRPYTASTVWGRLTYLW
jgi:MtrB/PioB family decaheme-associated outer membrane protein